LFRRSLDAGRTGNLANRGKIESELQAMLEAGNYEGLGWNVLEGANRLDARVRSMIEDAISTFVRSGGPTSGDELTYLVSREVMRKFSPRLLVIIFSDVEVAHFGSYALHLAGIRTGDRLAYQVWRDIEAEPEYKGKTTMFVLPEFGRDPDGSATNGFFNHRSDSESGNGALIYGNSFVEWGPRKLSVGRAQIFWWHALWCAGGRTHSRA